MIELIVTVKKKNRYFLGFRALPNVILITGGVKGLCREQSLSERKKRM